MKASEVKTLQPDRTSHLCLCDSATNLVKYYLMLGGNKRRQKGDVFHDLRSEAFQARQEEPRRKKRQGMKPNTS